MEEPLKVNDGIVIPGSELRFTASRSGGPGGQHVNKTSSRVTLHWDLSNTDALNPQQRARVMRRLRKRLTRDGNVLVHVDDHRSQHRNKEIARQRLAEAVSKALEQKKKRIPTSVSRGAQKRRLETKKRRSSIKRLRRTPGDE